MIRPEPLVLQDHVVGDGAMPTQLRTIALILSGEFITKSLDIHFELDCDQVAGPGVVIFGVVSGLRGFPA